jgi:nucleotide-binding universal stress UspA family protein
VYMATMAQATEQQQGLGFKRILIATDFSDISERALAYSLQVARLYGSELFVVHAVPPAVLGPIPVEPLPKELDLPRFEAEQQMKHLAHSPSMADLTHHLRIEQGFASDVLPQLIALEEIDLLVLGTHGRRGVKKLALGSVAEGVLRSVECPVLTVGQDVVFPSGILGFRRILFASDFGAGAAKAFAFALSMAQKYQATLVLVHAVPPMPVMAAGEAAYGPPGYLVEEMMAWEAGEKEAGTKKLRKLIPVGTELAHEPEYIVRIDAAANGILSAAADRNVDLIVMGVKRVPSPRAAAHTPWSVAHQVLCRARCPVLTVRN